MESKNKSPEGPWRVHARLELMNPEILVHRSLKRALMSRLQGLTPVAYDRDKSIILSFVLPDGGPAGQEFATAKIQEITDLLPPTSVHDFEIYQGQFPERRED